MNAFRLSFLVATDVMVIAMLVALLTGCATTGQQQYRNGDFVSHMAALQNDARASVALNNDASHSPVTVSAAQSARS